MTNMAICGFEEVIKIKDANLEKAKIIKKKQEMIQDTGANGLEM